MLGNGEKPHKNYMISHNVLEIDQYSQKYKVTMLNYVSE